MKTSIPSKIQYLLLSILSGLLLWASWPTSPLTFLIFIAFIPIIILAERIEKVATYALLTFLSLLVWNVGTTWWVGNTPVPASGVFANIFNSMLMLFPLLAFRGTLHRFGKPVGYLSLVVYWLTFEHIHYNWELSWPWLTVGNVFAMHPNWIQWYEYTGSSGGTLWVLLVNILIYRAVLYAFTDQKVKKKLLQFIVPAAIISIPILLGPSLRFIGTFILKARSIEVVIVQPNIDPYDEKFDAGSSLEQLNHLLELTSRKITSNTRYIIWPETALFTTSVQENRINQTLELRSIRNFLQSYPDATIITGAVTYKFYTAGEEIPSTSRVTENGDHYDVFNSALQIDTSQAVQIYHKSKLVPGVELIPYLRYFSFLKDLALDFGGITGSYGRNGGVPFFSNPKYDINTLPLICYESVYSEYVAETVRKGPNFIAIITNDGWWGDTQGYKQHLQYARIRAIETRRWIARSANTGSSAFISPSGAIIDPQPYWQASVISYNLKTLPFQTFYVKYGDYLAKISVLITLALLVYSIVHRIIQRRKHV
ncbi:apolipoprotein N-acyltransferase [Chitinophaga caeni]|uniref:Apolipoprotein N-acyltransferase n=1 Tax=Chitinophaga caeni TaxID=2029983 RepID=A0A291QTV4_9BACT|nr:apolipoprotein N-acyltransferase [Chitinophaga caeni]ATL47312.1 apolipoprotein N-acyltransferase [Chitinophaga caeni]